MRALADLRGLYALRANPAHPVATCRLSTFPEEDWIRNYRDRLAPEDLADPALLDESRRALDEISQLLRLGSVFPFQQVAKVEGATIGSIR